MGGAELTASAKGRRLDPKRFAAQLRGDLDWIVMRALEKDRMRRYDNAKNLAEDIERHLRNEPVLARPPSTAYRFQKLVRRNKLAVTAVTAVAAALIIGLCVATWSLVRERKALLSERNARQAAVEARAEEKQQRRLAVEQQKQAEQYLYDADMLLAQQALAENNLGHAVDLLERHIPRAATNASKTASVLSSPRDLRDWEWRYLWREAQGDELDEVWPAGADWVAFAPEDDVLALAGLNKVSVWRTSPKRKLAEFPQTSGVRQIAISSDGALAALIEKEVKLWNVARDNAPLASLIHDEPPFAMAFSPDGRILASAGTNQVWLWDLSARRAKPIEIADGARLAFSPDGTTLAVTQRHADQLILWDLAKNVEIGRLPSIANLSGGYGSLAYSPDGRFLAAAIGPGRPQIRIWNVASGNVITNLVGHTAGVFACAFADGGKLLASAGGDQTIKLWDVATWAEVRTLRGHHDMVVSLTASSDGTILATADKRAEVKLWKIKSSPKPESVRFFSGIKDTGAAARAHWALSSDGRHALTAHTNGTFTVWKSSTLQPLVQAAIPCTNLARVAIAAPQLLAFADENGTLHVGSPKAFSALPIPSGSATAGSGSTLPSQCWGIAFSADGRKLAALSSDLTVAVWDTTIGHCVTRFEAPRLDTGLGNSRRFSPFRPAASSWPQDLPKAHHSSFRITANRAKWRLPEGKVYTIC